MDVRSARLEDADEMAEVLRRSITELCVADHQNDERVLAKWLANKTPTLVRLWISQSDQQVIVAVMEDRIAGVGAATKGGLVLLNYVSPEHRFMRVSTALLDALEAYIITQGAKESRLVSTHTARPFYLNRGYRDDEMTSTQSDEGELRMNKQLPPSQTSG
jgi:GNAT superfamily N-acetyltransferase